MRMFFLIFRSSDLSPFTMSARRGSLNDVKLPTNAIKGLDLDTLAAINEQEDASFYEFLQGMDLEDLKKVHREREELQEKLREQAVANCELEPRFKNTKSELRRKCIESTDLKEDYDRKFEELKKIVGQHDPSAMLKEMAQAVKDAENTSEDFASDFLKGKGKGNISIEDFSEKFVEYRKQYWLRKVKAEKMNELVRNQQPKPMPRSPRLGGHSPTTTHPAHSLQPVSGQQHPPYPSEGPRRTVEPSPVASLPPYHTQAGASMPQAHPIPGHPFPAAAFASYRQPQPTGYASRPPPRPQPPNATRAPYGYR